jgi:hypothetical protein
MKRFVLLLVGLLAAVPAIQAQRNCGTMDHYQQQLQNNPNVARQMAKEESRIQHWVRENGSATSNRVVITIPTVVHVVYNSSVQNISQAQVESQIDVLNEDFRKLNADASNIPAAWTSIAADSEIEFCLARRDPQGNPSTGITRTQTSSNNFSTNDNVKSSSTGGKDPWPASDYLNIWVCNLGFGLLGYAQFPGQSASTDGVVIGYRYFGRTGTVSSPFNKGRTTTHEVGHWLNLRHIWGDDGGSCNGSDQVGDTPNMGDSNYGCPNYPLIDNCATSAPGAMFMNYMDYVDDACMYMFTNGQKTRMTAVLNGSRSSLQGSMGCVAVNQAANDAAITAIISPTGTSCTGTIVPEVTLYNWGTNTLTSVTINWQVDAGAVQTMPWTGNLASLANTNVTLPSQAVTPGAHTIIVYTSLPNGATDGDPSNDSFTGSFTISSASGQSVPFVETFENGAFPPTGWNIFNPDNDYTWERSNSVGYNSSRSAWVNNFDYNASGEVDDLILPVLDFTNLSVPMVSWDLSYALYSQTGYSDTLQVWASTDCGGTWAKVWEKFDAALATVTPVFTTDPFVPANTGEWRREDLFLSAYGGMNSVQLKFRNSTDYENNLYIDNINVGGAAVSIEQSLLNEGINLFPNPGTGRFNLQIDVATITALEVKIYNALGELVAVQSVRDYTGQRLQIDLEDGPSGVYFVNVYADGVSATKKLSKF